MIISKFAEYAPWTDSKNFQLLRILLSFVLSIFFHFENEVIMCTLLEVLFLYRALVLVSLSPPLSPLPPNPHIPHLLLALRHVRRPVCVLLPFCACCFFPLYSFNHPKFSILSLVVYNDYHKLILTIFKSTIIWNRIRGSTVGKQQMFSGDCYSPFVER